MTPDESRRYGVNSRGEDLDDIIARAADGWDDPLQAFAWKRPDHDKEAREYYRKEATGL